MGNIPVFTRTVLPDNAVGGAAVEVARAQSDINAQNIEQNRHEGLKIQNTMDDFNLKMAEATNANWVNENAVAFKKQALEQQDTMREQRMSNPNGFHKDFDKSMEDAQQSYLDTAPSEVARNAILHTMGETRTSLLDDNQRWEHERQLANFGEGMDKTAQNLGVMAFRAGKAGQDLDKTGYMNDVNASVIAASTFVAPDKVGNVRRQMSQMVAKNYLEGLAETDPTKAKAAVDSKKYDQALGADGIEHVQNAIEQEQNKRKAEVRLEVSDQVEELDKATKLGLPVPAASIQALADKTSAAGMAAETVKIKQLGDLNAAVSGFAIRPLTDQSAAIEGLKKDIAAGNLGSVDKYAAFQSILTAKKEALEKDPYSFYVAHDVIKPPQPLNFADPQAMKQELDNRRVATQQVKDIDGVQVPLFTAPEAKQLKTMFDTTEPRQMGAVLASLGNAMKPQEMAALGRVMAPESKILGTALAVGDPVVGERILSGARIKGEVSPELVRTEVNTQLGSAIADTGKLEGVHDAVYAYYKQLSLMDGDASTNMNSDRVKRAVTDILGPVATVDTYTGWGGESKILPYRDGATNAWVTEDRLQNIFKNGITDDVLKQTNGGLPESPAGGKWSADQVKANARFVTAGDGKYVAVVPGLGYVSDKQGQPYVFDARKIEQAAFTPTVQR